ncbi:hypothetical protein C8J56DRAFT_1033772 [Mycena floridula]|nr:hypothetical protein C8J56DRAFT_1033772 [Mycena floridula]
MLTALVFHDFQRSTRSPAYHLTLSRMAFTTYWPHRAKEFESVADSLATHRLVPHDALLDYQMVNNEGYLIVDRFQHHNHGPTWKLRFRVPSPRRSLAMTSKSKSISHLNSPLQSMMAMANKFMSGQFVQSHLSDYYNYLEEICTPHFGSSRNVTFCITELQTTATTFHISTTPFRFKLVAFKEDVKTECLSGLRLQFTIAISSLNPSFIFDQRYWLLVADSMKASSDSGKGGLSPFSIWASQAHYIIQAQGINPTRIQTGQEVIPHRDVENALGLHIDIFTQMWHYNVPPQLYPILRQIHETCGFNPDSTEMAEYLGYPLLETSFEGESSESDTTISASEMLTRESSEIGSDDESENGSTSSDDTFLSADSKI